MKHEMLTSKRICNLSTKEWFSFPLLGLLLVPIFGQPSKARPNSDAFCEEAKIGTYLIVSQGSKKNIPLGQLQLETWNSDGSLKGTRFLREGKKYSTSHYTGRWKNVDNCSVKINRNDGGMDSHAILNSNGQPHFGILGTPGVVASERWFPQSNMSCTKDTITGEILSLQEGHQFQNGRWKSNRVIQREQWIDWTMSGVAISSYSGKFEVARYQGKFTQISNCIGRIQQQDAYGVTYDYIAILRTDSKGYAYLQTQGGALTVAILEHIESK